jgi:hypothetical protein
MLGETADGSECGVGMRVRTAAEASSPSPLVSDDAGGCNGDRGRLGEWETAVVGRLPAVGIRALKVGMYRCSSSSPSADIGRGGGWESRPGGVPRGGACQRREGRAGTYLRRRRRLRDLGKVADGRVGSQERGGWQALVVDVCGCWDRRWDGRSDRSMEMAEVGRQERGGWQMLVVDVCGCSLRGGSGAWPWGRRRLMGGVWVAYAAGGGRRESGLRLDRPYRGGHGFVGTRGGERESRCARPRRRCRVWMLERWRMGAESGEKAMMWRRWPDGLTRRLSAQSMRWQMGGEWGGVSTAADTIVSAYLAHGFPYEATTSRWPTLGEVEGGGVDERQDLSAQRGPI